MNLDEWLADPSPETQQFEYSGSHANNNETSYSLFTRSI